MNTIISNPENQEIPKQTYNTDDLAQLFCMSRAWVSANHKKMTAENNFPAPFARGKWLSASVDAWFKSPHLQQVGQKSNIPITTPKKQSWQQRANAELNKG